MVDVLKLLKDKKNREKFQTAFTELKKNFLASPKSFIWDGVALFSEAKSFESNQFIGNTKLNELGLHRFRVQQAAKMAEQRRANLAKWIDPEDVAQFKEKGFILKENFLPADEFELLKKELLSTPLETRETLQGDTVTRRMSLDYDALTRRLPITKRLLDSSKWQNLLNYVASFKVQPMCYVQVIFSQVRKAKSDPQTNLHSDTFHPSAKAWLFLNDVTTEDGPFVYVPGSHLATEKRLQWEHQKAIAINEKTEAMTRRGSFRVSEEEVTSLGYAKPQAFAVKANTLVIADTYGFHARGKSLSPSLRIELWAYARRNPFLPWIGLNPLSLPLLKNNLVPLYWRSLDILEEKYQRNNPWKKVGKLYAEDPAVIKTK